MKRRPMLRFLAIRHIPPVPASPARSGPVFAPDQLDRLHEILVSSDNHSPAQYAPQRDRSDGSPPDGRVRDLRAVDRAIAEIGGRRRRRDRSR